MPPSCCVPTCKLMRNNSEKLSYHEIPSKEPLRTNWIKQIGILTGNKFWQPTSESAVVCSKHFIEPDFVETPLRRRLKPTSVPSVFYMMQGKPYFVPSRRRKYESPTTPNLFPNSQHHEIVNNEGNETIDIIDNSNVIENSKYDAFLQASFADKKFLEMLQLNLEMLEVANHFLADYSLLE